MDGRMLLAFARMLPKLQAEASLRRINEMVIALGHVKPHVRRSAHAALERAARGGAAPKHDLDESRRALMALAAAGGVGIVEHPASRKG